MLAAWLDRHADPNWRNAYKLHSMWVAGFWGVVSGLWYALPAFQNLMPPVNFAILCVAFSLAMVFARFTKQPGVE